MSTWREQIEAQIVALNNIEPESDRDYMYDCAQNAGYTMQALLDVAVAADDVVRGDASVESGYLNRALDKLREVSGCSHLNK